MKKRILVLCLCVILSSIALAFGTMAYFTDTAAANVSVIQMGNLNIRWVSPAADDEADIFGGHMVPGVFRTVDLNVENDGDYDAYLRVNIGFSSEAAANLFEVSFSDSDAFVSATSGVGPFEKQISLEGQTVSYWFYSYRIDTVLAAQDDDATVDVDEDNAILYARIGLKSSLDHDDIALLEVEANRNVVFLAEAIQTSETYADSAAAFDIFDATLADANQAQS